MGVSDICRCGHERLQHPLGRCTVCRDDRTSLGCRMFVDRSDERPPVSPARIEPPVDVRPDPVNKPAHYRVGSLETIDIIEAIAESYKDDPAGAYLAGTAVKYIGRAMHKGNAVQDLEKSVRYIVRLINHIEGKKSWER